MASIRKFVRSDFVTIQSYAGVNRVKADLARCGVVVVLEEETHAFPGVWSTMDIVRRPITWLLTAFPKSLCLTRTARLKMPWV